MLWDVEHPIISCGSCMLYGNVMYNNEFGCDVVIPYHVMSYHDLSHICHHSATSAASEYIESTDSNLDLQPEMKDAAAQRLFEKGQVCCVCVCVHDVL